MKALKNYKLSSFNLFLLSILAIGLFYSCNNNREKDVTQTEIVEQPEDINARAERLIRSTLREILNGDKDLPDSFHVKKCILTPALI